MSVWIHCTKSPEISSAERELLEQIQKAERFPVCRFELRSSKEKDLISTALDTVHLEEKADTMEEVKARSELLRSLEEKGLIELNYQLISYVKSDYQKYHDSELFALLNQMVEEGKEREGFLFDYAFLKKGTAALTLKGNYQLRGK